MRRTAFIFFVAACLALATAGLSAQNYPTAPQTYPQQGYPQQGYPQAYPGSYQNPVIPEGTNITIRTDEAITSQNARPGQQYPVQVAQNITDQNGNVIIPAGSPATVTVVNTGKSVLGGNEMALALQSISFNGRRYMVNTNSARQSTTSQAGIGANKRTAEYVGGGALLGTLVGAVAGGGKGAAIGAILGGGGGAAAQVLTRGKSLNVPAESVLTFKTDQPIYLQ